MVNVTAPVGSPIHDFPRFMQTAEGVTLIDAFWREQSDRAALWARTRGDA